jgi:gamma-glutamylcyclotransferase (GGCT)/AIG2-like uncharacterized protein YtfP
MRYFGYGSNLHAGDLARWCREHGHGAAKIRAIEPAWLPDMEVAFHYFSRARGGGALDVRERVGSCVPGMLFEVDEAGWRALDAKEGPRYVRSQRTVLTELGEEAPAAIYTVAAEHHEPRHVPPSDEYLALVCRALEEHRLPSDHVRCAAQGIEAPRWPLFLYGTLMRGEDRHGLVPSARFADAWVSNGELLSFGAYPGMRLGGTRRVAGELAELDLDEATVRSIDEYEGFLGYGVLGSLFRRVVVAAELTGEVRHAWAYVYAGATHGARLIASGDWRRREE